MDLQSAADLKSKLRMEITKAVEVFEEATKLTVEGIDVYRHSPRGSKSKLERIELTVEL